MRIHAGCAFLASLVVVTSCTPLPTVEQSRERLWALYAQQPVDKLLMDMGTPERESHLTDGSRLLMYQFSSVYDYGSPYEHASGCEVTFVAKAPGYRLEDIAMKGSAYECNILAKGRTGVARYPYIPPAPPYTTGIYPRFYRYR